MPVPQQENETVEVLLVSMITSSAANKKYDIGAIFNAGFRDITTGESGAIYAVLAFAVFYKRKKQRTEP